MLIDLGKVRLNFDRRATHLLRIMDKARTLPMGRERDRRVAYVMVELLSALGYVGKEVFLAHAWKGYTATGQRLTGRYPGKDLALAFAATHVNGPRAVQRGVPGRGEPNWYAYDHFNRCATAAALPPHLSAAYGLNPKSRQCVRAVRNFYAHRAEGTYLQACTAIAKHGLQMVAHPTEFLPTAVLGPDFLMDRWIYDYTDIVYALTS